MRILHRLWTSRRAIWTIRSFLWKPRESAAARPGLPRSTVELLRSQGWDVVHVYQCGLSAVSDEQILEYARTDSRVVCTLDAEFHSILAVSGAARPSMVRIRREGLRG